MSLVDQKLDEAYRAWDLQEYDTTIEAFLKAAALEHEAASKRSRWASADRSLLYELRAGFCMWQSGKVAEALPYLEKVRGFHWRGARLWGDRWDSDTAYTYLILPHATSGNKRQFRILFREACENGERLKLPFSSVIPNQKKLILACMELEDRDCLKTVINNVAPEHLEKDQELKLLSSQAQKFLCALCG